MSLATKDNPRVGDKVVDDRDDRLTVRTTDFSLQRNNTVNPN